MTAIHRHRPASAALPTRATDGEDPTYDPNGPLLHPRMVGKLVEKPGGLPVKALVSDVRDLVGADAPEKLVARGWKYEGPSKAGDPVYTLGEPTLWLRGQRAEFGRDKNTLVSFAGAFIELIQSDKAGAVQKHALQQVPG